METILEIRHLDAYYGKAHVVQDVSLSLPKGTVVGVVGRNGVGKTTFLKGIMGLVATTAETVSLGNNELKKWPTDRRARRGLAFMPQELRVIPGLTVNETFRLAISATKSTKRVSEVAEVIPEILPLLSRISDKLSGGQKQLVGFARSLLLNPSVLLLDEPMEGIMPALIAKLEDIILAIANSGMSIIIVEQNLDTLRKVTSHLYLMDKGRFVADGSTEEMFSSQAIFRHLQLG